MVDDIVYRSGDRVVQGLGEVNCLARWCNEPSVRKLLPITDVLTDMQQAVLFDVLAMSELEQKLQKLILNPELQTRLADAAFERLMQKHTWHNNAQAIIAGMSV